MADLLEEMYIVVSPSLFLVMSRENHCVRGFGSTLDRLVQEIHP